ncbi:uncharacterized protein LOC127079905 [Lathyrus oleraceus]|uniref:uncharacterized protein LOC127079905 n=1 Tax=Pisum sativum TaxID=3888 RepID=UPI0021CFD784|nr:uncharacterized protein LOC127079905 [Pisum sativum]
MEDVTNLQGRGSPWDFVEDEDVDEDRRPEEEESVAKNPSVTATKFKELVKFYPCYNGVVAEESKCIKSESGLHPEIKQGIGYHEIHQFLMLENKCRIYDEDIRAHSAHYKSLSEKKGKNQYCGKPYIAPTDKGKQKASDEKKPSRGETFASVKCFKCGELSYCANECKNNFLRCLKYGKIGHRIADCKSVGSTCYNCVEQGHISTHCHKLKKVQSEGEVFALTRSKITISYILIRDATHSFVSLECVEKLGLKLSSMVGSMIVDTPTLGLYHFKSLMQVTKLFVSPKQVDEFMKDEVKVFMIFASMKYEGKVVIDELLLVCEFMKVFPDDISDLQLKCEVEFVIDLVPGSNEHPI